MAGKKGRSGKRIRWDVSQAVELREKRGLKIRELAEILGVSKTTVHRELQKVRKRKEYFSAKKEPASTDNVPSVSPTPAQSNKVLPERDARGHWVSRTYPGPLPTDLRKKPKISNRELFDQYMTPDFIEWLIRYEPKTFADLWTRLQPKDVSVGLTGNISMEVVPFDPRIVEIQEVLNNALSAQAQIRRIREIVGLDHAKSGADTIIEVEPLQIEAQEGGMAGAGKSRGR